MGCSNIKQASESSKYTPLYLRILQADLMQVYILVDCIFFALTRIQDLYF